MSSSDDDFPIEKSQIKPIQQKGELIKPKHPDFKSLNKHQQYELFLSEFVQKDVNEPIDLFLIKMGISSKEYRAITKHPDYVKDMHDQSLRERFVPYLPQIYDSLGREASNGDLTAIKTALQSGGQIGPDNVTLINQNLMNMGRKELEQELKLLLEEVESHEQED